MKAIADIAMHFDILHETPGRLRVHCRGVRLAAGAAAEIRAVLTARGGIVSADLSLRTGNLLVAYSRLLSRDSVLDMLAVFEPAAENTAIAMAAAVPAVARRDAFLDDVLTGFAVRGVLSFARNLFMPMPVRCALTVLKALPLIARGVWSLLRGRLDLAVLNAGALCLLGLGGRFSAMGALTRLLSAVETLAGDSRAIDSVGTADADANLPIRFADRAAANSRLAVNLALLGLVFSGLASSGIASLVHTVAKIVATDRKTRELPYRPDGDALLDMADLDAREVEVEIA